MDRSRDWLTEPSFSSAGSGVPEYGLLTRTLVHSSVVKQVLPARIRRADYCNDVVFVGETYVELNLLTPAHKLLKLGSKTDLDAEVRDAKVIGTQRRANPVVKLEETGETGIVPLPADILALTLDTGELSFMYARDTPEQGQVDFVESRVRIGSRGVHPSHLGRSIRVDPRSRAMAVTAYQDSFRVYALHSMEEMQRQMAAGEKLNPIREEKTFDVQGCVIVHAEFLYPAKDAEEMVMLVVYLVDPKGVSRLQLYEWVTTEPLSKAKQNGMRGLMLEKEITLPLHIIPVTISSTFYIVTETYLYVACADDIMSGHCVFDRLEIGNPASPSTSALVTSWARPYRDPAFFTNHDVLYIAKENGEVYFLEIGNDNGTAFPNVSLAVQLQCCVGSAFAAVDVGLRENDVLIAGGEMSSGGIYTVSLAPWLSTDPIKLEEAVQNWAPVIDFQLESITTPGAGIGADRDRVFACTGRGQHGAITELRYGVQANIISAAEYVPSIGALFVLRDAAGRGYFILSSLPDGSQMMFVDPAEDAWEDCSENSRLEMSGRTLAAGSFAANGEGCWSVQITPTAITAVELNSDVDLVHDEMETGEQRNGVGRTLQRRCEVGDRIIAAAVYDDAVLVAMRSGEEVRLVLAKVDVTAEGDQFLVPVGAPKALEHDPTFVDFQVLHGRPLALVGTAQAMVQVFLCDSNSGLVPVIEQSMLEAGHTSQDGEVVLAVCESVVIISSGDFAKLLCGLRGGTVVVFDVTTSETSIDLKWNRVIEFGPIPVRLHLDVKRTDSAFVLAGPELYRFDMPFGEFRAAQICFSDVDSVEGVPALQAFAQIDNADVENIIICATSEHILLADVGQSQKICGTRFKLKETPRRVMYYKPLNVFIVGCSRLEDDEPRYGSPRAKAWSSLQVIDARTGKSRLQDEILLDERKGEPLFNRPDEQIFCMMEWSFTLNGQIYSHIAVGTGTSDPDRRSGRVMIFHLRQTAAGNIVGKRTYELPTSGQVYSLAAYGEKSIVFCADSTLHMRTLSPLTHRFDKPLDTTLALRSPAVHISVAEPNIHLSLASDSLLLVHHDQQNNTLDPTFSDTVARNGFFHLPLLPDLLLATDKRNALIGLYPPAEQRGIESMQTIFEAELPSSISRIRVGNCRAPWSTGRGRRLPGTVAAEKTLVASGVDGSFFQLQVLTKEATVVLRGVVEAWRVWSGKTERRRGAGEGWGSEARGRVVSGDELKRVLGSEGGWLRGAMESGREDVLFRWVQAAKEVMGDVEVGGTGQGEVKMEDREEVEGRGGDVYEKVRRWVEMLLNDAVL